MGFFLLGVATHTGEAMNIVLVNCLMSAASTVGLIYIFVGLMVADDRRVKLGLLLVGGPVLCGLLEIWLGGGLL